MTNRQLLARHVSRNKHWMLIAAILLSVLAGYWLVQARSQVGFATSNTKLNLLASGWNYLSGVSPQADGLHVSYLGRAIVQQNGQPGQPNPAVNVYGTHLHASGDFALSAQMKNISGTASLRLYGSVPIIQDEFRVEPKSLELKLSDSSLVVSSWNGYTHQNLYKQLPALTQSYAIKLQPSNTVTILRQGSNMLISLNGQLITTLAKTSLSGSEVWFGMSAVSSSDNWVLADLSVDATNGVSLVDTQNVPAYPKSDQALQVLASQKRPGFLVGAAMAMAPAVADPAYDQIAFGGNFGQMTTENVLKWQFIEPQSGIYDFHEADALIAIAKKNGLVIHGHNLVFGEANPQWVQQLPTATAADRQQVKQVMVDHITQTVKHFKGQIASWDVVNEPLADYDTAAGTDGLRQHIWYTAMGESYIGIAFAAAHQADPSAKLYINDFGLEANGDRWTTFLALVTKLKAQGVPIDGVGFEAHVYQPGDEIDPTVLKDHIRILAGLGLTARVSEMDVYSDNGTVAQAKQYADVFQACFSEPNCVSWSTWGVTDRYDLYQDDAGRLQSGQDFLWDAQAHPTPAFTQIQQLLIP